MARVTALPRAALAALLAASLLVVAFTSSGCGREEPPKRYTLKGQVLAVDTTKNELSISHEDIPNYMPAMTMVYMVKTPALMTGRTPGELITATLEVKDSLGYLVEITRTGTAPLTVSENQTAMAAGVLDAGDELPDTALIDQTDKRRSLSEWKGVPFVITFTYTRCPLPNFCPLMDQNLATLQRRLADDTVLRGRVKLVTVTIDPAHDTPAILAAHAAKLKADTSIWTFLTGDTITVERFAGTFGIGIMRDPADATQITHNLRTAVVGADGKIAKIYSGADWTPGALLADLHDVVARAKN
jgi:protein SCO1/2